MDGGCQRETGCRPFVDCAQADSQSISLGGISRAPPTLDQLSADKDLLAKWASKADGSTPGDLLEALSEAASVFVRQRQTSLLRPVAGRPKHAQPKRRLRRHKSSLLGAICLLCPSQAAGPLRRLASFSSLPRPPKRPSGLRLKSSWAVSKPL